MHLAGPGTLGARFQGKEGNKKWGCGASQSGPGERYREGKGGQSVAKPSLACALIKVQH